MSETTIDEFIYYLSLHNHVEIEMEMKSMPYYHGVSKRIHRFAVAAAEPGVNAVRRYNKRLKQWNEDNQERIEHYHKCYKDLVRKKKRKKIEREKPEKIYTYRLTNSPNMKISTHAKHMIKILKSGGTLG